ncbi:hypothetical protein A1QK_11735 [Vibrio genomosp. F10 str. 9ZD137]|nr:hypothetical protein A1QK_11735 [Vibrio genomosp. F10 str. 9ZD137]
MLFLNPSVYDCPTLAQQLMQAANKPFENQKTAFSMSFPFDMIIIIITKTRMIRIFVSLYF